MKKPTNMTTIIIFVSFFWLIEIVNYFLGHRLTLWGIYPRTVRGLPGIILSPFLHAGFSHLIKNSIPFVVLGFLVMQKGKKTFLEITLFVILFSGACTWLFARSSYHVGASGLIFGFFGFLVASGWYSRDIWSIIISGVTLFVYGGIVWGVFPTLSYISWEGHLFGLIGGVVSAYLKGLENDTDDL